MKIDGEFVAQVHESSVDRTILRSIVGIAKDLGKQTVAEFVSHPEILEVCREEGVDFAQGFLIGKPVPYDEFVSSFLPSGPRRLRTLTAADGRPRVRCTDHAVAPTLRRPRHHRVRVRGRAPPVARRGRR